LVRQRFWSEHHTGSVCCPLQRASQQRAKRRGRSDRAYQSRSQIHEYFLKQGSDEASSLMRACQACSTSTRKQFAMTCSSPDIFSTKLTGTEGTPAASTALMPGQRKKRRPSVPGPSPAAIHDAAFTAPSQRSHG